MDTETSQNVIKKIKNKVGLLPESEPEESVPSHLRLDHVLGIQTPKKKRGGKIRKTLLNTKSKEILKNIKKGNGINII